MPRFSCCGVTKLMALQQPNLRQNLGIILPGNDPSPPLLKLLKPGVVGLLGLVDCGHSKVKLTKP